MTCLPPAGAAPRGLPSVSAAARPERPRARRVVLLAGLLALLGLTALLAGCASQYPQTTLDPHSTDFGPDIQNLFVLIFWPAVLVFVVVEGALLYTIVRYRQRPGHGRPRQIHGNTRLEIAWTIAPAVVLAFIAVPTVKTIFVTQANVAPGSVQIHVIGHQWWWEFQYPELGVVTANEFHVPAGQTVGFTETSADVIHSFWVPAMGGKRDVVPNHQNYLWFTPAQTGTFLGQCAEYCLDAHADMRLRMIVDTPQDFQAWVDRQKQNAQPQPDAQTNMDLLKKGEQLVTTGACVGCHTIQGTPANGKVGPNLTHVGSRQTIAAGILENNRDNIARWVRNPPAIKPGAKMPANLVSEDDARAVAEYLYSLK